MNVIEYSWDLSKPIKKGQRFKFSWSAIGGLRIKGYAIATENFKKVKLSEKEAIELDTNTGIHYYGKAIAHYK